MWPTIPELSKLYTSMLHTYFILSRKTHRLGFHEGEIIQNSYSYVYTINTMTSIQYTEHMRGKFQPISCFKIDLNKLADPALFWDATNLY